jgi:hypothetical protein
MSNHSAWVEKHKKNMKHNVKRCGGLVYVNKAKLFAAPTNTYSRRRNAWEVYNQIFPAWFDVTDASGELSAIQTKTRRYIGEKRPDISISKFGHNYSGPHLLNRLEALIHRYQPANALSYSVIVNNDKVENQPFECYAYHGQNRDNIFVESKKGQVYSVGERVIHNVIGSFGFEREMDRAILITDQVIYRRRYLHSCMEAKIGDIAEEEDRLVHPVRVCYSVHMESVVAIEFLLAPNIVATYSLKGNSDRKLCEVLSDDIDFRDGFCMIRIDYDQL